MPTVVSAQPHIIVAAVGDPESPGTWSGTTAGVLAGLRDLGVRASGLDLTLPSGLEQALLVGAGAASRNRYEAQSAALTVCARSWLARRRLRGERSYGVIQIGSTFSLPPGTPYVTLEDMTLRQAAAIHPVFARMSPGAIAAWEQRRARIYGGARACAAASHWAGESLSDDYDIPAERIAVVGLGANNRVDAAVAQRSWHPARYLFVGLDWERKGGPELLRAFARLRKLEPDATLDLVGNHPSVDAAGVRGHGRLSRIRDRPLIAELFARATCLVMPSTVEPFGIVHVEAAAAAIPSIGTTMGGPRDLIGTDAGLLVAPGDEEALLQAMRRLADPSTAERMGRAARERSRLYTWPQVAGRLLRVLALEDVELPPLATLL